MLHAAHPVERRVTPFVGERRLAGKFYTHAVRLILDAVLLGRGSDVLALVVAGLAG